MNFLFFIAILYIIYNAFTINLFVGIGATILLLVYVYFKWYPTFCIARGRKVYGNNPEKALEIFAKAEKRMNIAQLQTYAYYLLREGKTEKSEEIYKNLLSAGLKPELRLKIRSDYAVFLLKTGQIDEAIAELEEITVHYTNTTTYGSLGYCYLLKDSIRKAKNYNLEAYDYNSDDPVILDNMVQLYIKLTDYNEAKIYADLLIEKKPYFVEGYYDAAYVYMKLGDITRAKELLEDARCCRITFMSVVKEADLDAFEAALNANCDYEHKLGKFSGEEEYTEEDFKNLPEIEEEKPEEEDIDEDDPFI